MIYADVVGRDGIDKDAKEARNKQIFEMWLACHTRDEIAGAVGCSTGEVSAITSETADLPNLTKSDLAAAEHLTDFNVPIYNVWKFKEKSPGPGHFGNTKPVIDEIGSASGVSGRTVSRVQQAIQIERSQSPLKLFSASSTSSSTICV